MTDVSEQSVADVLRRAADLIEPEGRWCQGAGARDGAGKVVGSFTPIATCWCTITAISKVAGREDNVASDARTVVRKMLNTKYLGDWNDAPERTQAEVVAALRSAALLAAPRAGEGVDRG